jgi:hypothetical protein
VKRGPKGPAGYPYYEQGHGHESVTKAQADFLRRRVGSLATFQCASTPLIDLLANAYLWGLQDAVEYQEMGDGGGPMARKNNRTLLPGIEP